MKTVRLARHMMATRFELVLIGDDPARLRALGEMALAEIASIEQRFSFYSPTSELSRLNAQASRFPVPVAPDLLSLLAHAKSISELTVGAFDPTIGHLMHFWFPDSGENGLPSPEDVDRASQTTGMNHVLIDPSKGSIFFDSERLEIDLGGIAKGYAIDVAMSVLEDAGVEHALLHGGTSTVATRGSSFDGLPWKIGISDQDTLLAVVELDSCALSVSAQSGKRRLIEGDEYGHILDPKTGRPVHNTAVSAVICPRAATCDAFSTASIVMGNQTEQLAPHVTGVAVWAAARPPTLIYQTGMPAFQVPDQGRTFPGITPFDIHP